MSDLLWSHRLQQTRLPCPPLSPGVCSDSWPLSWWCSLTISSLPSSYAFAFNLSQHQGLFQWLKWINAEALSQIKAVSLGHSGNAWKLVPVLYNGLVQNTAVQWIVSSWGGLRPPHHPLREKELTGPATNGKSVSHLYPSLEVRAYRADPSISPRVQQLGGGGISHLHSQIDYPKQPKGVYPTFYWIYTHIWFPQNKDDLES